MIRAIVYELFSYITSGRDPLKRNINSVNFEFNRKALSTCQSGRSPISKRRWSLNVCKYQINSCRASSNNILEIECRGSWPQ